MKELRNKLNKRRRKRFRIHQVTEVFKCFCKRDYLSYPALYLHVRLKHQHRITAKDQATKLNLVNEQQHDPKKTTRLYELEWVKGKKSLKKYRQKNYSKTEVLPQTRSRKYIQKQEIKNQTISQIIQQYCEELQTQRQDYELDDISLLLYLVKASMNSNYHRFDPRQYSDIQKYCDSSDAKALPLSFNFLISVYIPQFCTLNATKLQRNCILLDLPRLQLQLKSLNDWLDRKKYSLPNQILN